MSKIHPTNNYVVVYTNRKVSNNIEDPENNIDVNKRKKLDIDGDGDVDFKDIMLLSKNKLKFISYLFDVSIDNIPWGAILSLIITCIASSIIFSNLLSCQNTVEKYFNISTFTNYLTICLFSIILLQLAVLLHGISVCILESSRECCKVKQVGCGCQQHSKKCISGCRCCQKCTRIGCQSLWAIFGTMFLLITYVFSLAQVCFSVLSTLSSYLFTQTCHSFSRLIENLISDGYKYIAEAKIYLQQADQTALEFLNKYHEFVNIQEEFTKSALGELNQVSSPTFVDNPKKELIIWDKQGEFGRKLTENTFNPELEIAKGRSFISVLNQTILETETNLVYYESQFENIKEVCFDYSSMYDNFYYIMIGCMMIAFSQLIIFAVHNKYFTIWNYEVKLIKNKIYN